MIKAMKTYGGSFVKALAVAWEVADSENRKRLETAFPEIVEKYTKMDEGMETASGYNAEEVASLFKKHYTKG